MTRRRIVGTALVALLACAAGGAARVVSVASLWEKKAAIPVAKGVRFLYQPPVEIGGRMYVVYGRVHEYDPATQGWRVFPNPMPTARNHHGTAAAGGRIYTIGGGLPGDVRLDAVEEFNPTTGEWRSCAAMPGPRRNMGASVVAGALYVLGGEGALTGAMPIVRYDPRSDTWTRMKSVTRMRHCWGAQAVNGKIYILGNVGREEVPDGALDEYDPARDTIAARTPLPRPRNAYAVAVANGRILVVGGEAADNMPVGHVDVYDPATGSWSIGADLAQPSRLSGAIALQDRLYVLGGLMTRDWEPADAGMWAIDSRSVFRD